MTLLFEETIDTAQAKQIPMRVLALLGDAVFSLYERQKLVLTATSARKMHSQITLRVSATKQAEMIAKLEVYLSEEEKDIVRMAGNLKMPGKRRSGQNAYRKSTAFEALLGYLYLTDHKRLLEILAK